MKIWETMKKKPWVAHLLRAVARYNNRMGAQFGGAITYFSVLAVVPLLMLSFAVAGITLTHFQPELLGQLKDAVTSRFARDQQMGEKISGVIDEAVHNWPGIGVFGLLSLAYAGAGWVSNLKSAVRAQWRPEFSTGEKKRNIALETLVNLGHLIVILALTGILAVSASASSTLNGWIVGLLGLKDMPGIGVAAFVLGLVFALASGWLLAAYVFRFFPQPGKPRKGAVAWGAFFVALGLYLLQLLAGTLVAMFTKNRAAALFGPVIVIMMIINLFAQLVLFCAAWIATANQPAVAGEYNEADDPLRNLPADKVEVADGHWDAARHHKAQLDGEEEPDERPHSSNPHLAWARQQRRLGVVGPEPEQIDRRTVVSKSAAQKSTDAAAKTGWVVGAATGLGLGAFIMRLIRR